MGDVGALQRSTGRDRSDWFQILDEWGAADRGYRESAAWLRTEHGLSRWWAQKLVVEYEQERGLRAPGVRRDGTFEVTATKTVSVPVADLFKAVVDGRRRSRWLPGRKLALRTSQPDRTARFDWEGGTTKVSVEFYDKGKSKATVAVAHRGLPDEKTAQAMKAMWRERLSSLKSTLEG